MYQNKVTRMGFLGSDPELRNNGVGCFNTPPWRPSLPTGNTKRISHAPNGTAVSPSSANSPTSQRRLRQGAHIQIEGELRSREYVSPKKGFSQRIWEIRVGSILKLDRAAKASPQEQEVVESPQEKAAT